MSGPHDESSGPPTGIATGVGSMPGTDPRHAAEVIAGEVALMHVPELPARGVGADVIGRCAALLIDLPMDTTTTGYRFGARNSAPARRARDLLRADLDAVEEIVETRALRGGWLKTQVCGPFTLAASVELTNGHRALSDAGAWRDVAASLAEGIATHVGDLRRRTGCDIVVQVDEPMLDAVLRGTVPPVHRYAPIAAVPAATVAEHLDAAIETVGAPVLLHDCGPRFAWEVVDQIGVWGIGFDLASIGARRSATADLDGLGAAIDTGLALALGAVPTAGDGDGPHDRDGVVDTLARLADTLGVARDRFAARVLVSPACGLAGSTDSGARSALALCSAVADALPHR